MFPGRVPSIFGTTVLQSKVWGQSVVFQSFGDTRPALWDCHGPNLCQLPVLLVDTICSHCHFQAFIKHHTEMDLPTCMSLGCIAVSSLRSSNGSKLQFPLVALRDRRGSVFLRYFVEQGQVQYTQVGHPTRSNRSYFWNCKSFKSCHFSSWKICWKWKLTSKSGSKCCRVL